MSNSIFRKDVSSEDLQKAYIELLKKCLTMWLWEASDGAHIQPFGNNLKTRTKKLLNFLLRHQVEKPLNPLTQRLEGRDWPRMAHTMIGMRRMDNLQFCFEDVLNKDVPGDLIETGVWRGGSTIFMRGILKAYGVKDRRVWVADSFQGLPPPDAEKNPADRCSIHHKILQLVVSLDEVKANFERFDLLDDQVCFLAGWFKDTLPKAPIKKLAVARLDGDMYGSTMDALTSLYPKLASGGYLIVDDYGSVPACRQAVQDYRKAYGISESIMAIDRDGVFWQRRSV